MGLHYCEVCKKHIPGGEGLTDKDGRDLCHLHADIYLTEIEDENAKLEARVRELERFENIINETGRKFWPAIGTPECRNAIHDPEKRGVFDVLVFINKLLNENS